MKIFNFNNTYIDLDNELYEKIEPKKRPNAKEVIFNDQLANKLGLPHFSPSEYLSGNTLPEGSDPIAQAYAGHQFGQLNILGDGRALLLGEHVDKNNNRYDIQLKGSGKTKYSRGGDGKGTLSSMLREYIISHAMENLGIPTTKSLGVIETGEEVYRDTINKGAILTRVASSHIRVGTFQFVAMKGNYNLLKDFTDYVIERHYPECKKSDNPYLFLLKSVQDRQIDLIINWLRVGFIHGVMNTDNVSISGETLDYGPCAFMDNYNPDTVFSSIDRNGRYKFSNQQYIGQWNMARFAECLIPLVDKDTDKSLKLINEIIATYSDIFKIKWLNMMSKKLGIAETDSIAEELIKELLDWMMRFNADYTFTFRSLLEPNFIEIIPNSNKELELWYEKWKNRDIDYNLIKTSNPSVIPRNNIVESVLSDASNKNNLEPLKELIKVLTKPYSNCENKYFTNPPENIDENYKTFCGT